jgi:hypothetical protein
MRFKFLLLIIFGVLSCTKDESEIPELTDLNPKVTKIILPGLEVNPVIKIMYDGELITDILQEWEPEVEDFIDSTHFYYTGSHLDSAVRVNTMSTFDKDTSFFWVDTTFFYFSENSAGQITEIAVRSKINNYLIDLYKLNYSSERFTSITGRYSGDSIVYNNKNEISEICEYSTQYVNSYILDRLRERLVIKSNNNRPNPFYLIYSRLGFPFFRVLPYTAEMRKGYNKDCIMDAKSYRHNTNGEILEISGRYNYSYDDKGRVTSSWISSHPEHKDLFQYSN